MFSLLLRAEHAITGSPQHRAYKPAQAPKSLLSTANCGVPKPVIASYPVVAGKPAGHPAALLFPAVTSKPIGLGSAPAYSTGFRKPRVFLPWGIEEAHAGGGRYGMVRGGSRYGMIRGGGRYGCRGGIIYECRSGSLDMDHQDME
jgi:hypothetical protein